MALRAERRGPGASLGCSARASLPRRCDDESSAWMMYGRIGPSWARATVDGWRSRAWRRARCSDTRAVPPPARAGSSTPSPSWCARATVENDANWHKLASIPSLPSELQERIVTSRRVTANTERGEASVASSRQRATERDSRAFGSPRASAEAVVAKAGVCARQRPPPNTALTPIRIQGVLSSYPNS